MQACPGGGADHSDGAGEALTDGEVHTGDTVDIMTRSGAVTETLIGDMEAATGVADTTTDLFTEEAVPVVVDSRIRV